MNTRSACFLFILFLFLTSFVKSNAQEKAKVIDSLTRVLQTDSVKKILPENEKVDIYNKLARLFQQIDIDKARAYGEKALLEAQNARYRKGEGHAFNILGTLFSCEGMYEKALDYHLKATEIMEETKDSIWLARIYTNIALAYDYQGEFEKSLEYNLKSLSIKEALNDEQGKAVTLNNIGVIYYNLGKYDEALNMHLQTIAIEDKISDMVGLVYSYVNIGEIYIKTGDLNKAEKAFMKSLEINKIADDRYIEILNYSNLGEVYNKMGKNEIALKCLQKSLELSSKLNDVDSYTSAFMQLGRFYYESGNLLKSIECLNKSFELAREAKYRPRMVEASLELTKPLKKLGRYSEALSFMEIYALTRDTIYKEETTRQIEDMKAKYETEKKEKEIEIQNLQIAKNEETIAKKNIALASSLGGGLLLLIFSITIYLQYRTKNIAYKHLLIQNLETVKCEKIREENGISPSMEIIIKYRKSTLSDKQKNEMATRLVQLLETEKIYRNCNLTIDELAEILETNRTYLSQTINEYFKQNFTNMLNEYRVKEARRLLTSKEIKLLSIEGIAKQVGFNSKSSFNMAFKNFTGLTPSYYLNSMNYKNNLID